MSTGWGPLHYAVEGGDLVILGALLQAGDYTAAQAEGSFTPLHLAGQLGRSQLIPMLLNARCASTCACRQAYLAAQGFNTKVMLLAGQLHSAPPEHASSRSHCIVIC